MDTGSEPWHKDSDGGGDTETFPPLHYFLMPIAMLFDLIYNAY